MAETGSETWVPAWLHFNGGQTVRGGVPAELGESDGVMVQFADGERQVAFEELKAIFFLRERAEEPVGGTVPPDATVLAVEFADGEVIRGRSTGYSPGRPGFFLYPLDRSKNEKIFVINAAVVSIDVEKL
jgi:hypothetical protein